MKIKKLFLRNFRGYESITLELDEALNVIIGKNDVGKSTILEALEIFFNNEKVKIDISDLNVKATKKEMSIGVSFEVDLDKEYLIDSNVKTNLKEEYLLNNENLLEIHKVWDCSKDKLTAASLKTYLKANYLAEFSANPLINLKISNLRKELEKYQDDIEDYEDVNKSISSFMRKAIYSNCIDKTCKETIISLDKEDGKEIYESIKKEFPLFYLFQTDRTNKDTDKEVQDPLKVITKQAISEVQDKLDSVKEEIEKKAIEIGEETLAKLQEMAPDVAKTLEPNITNKAWDSLFSFSFDGDDGIPINKRGSGVRRLILLNYFRAEAERSNTSGKNIVYAIEEPETSQHPDHQIMLIEALKELSQKKKVQVIITTHTPEIAKLVYENNLILIDFKENQPEIINDENKLHLIAETLGIMPYLSKLVICVEGESDIKYLININQNIEEFREIIDLKEQGISIIPMFGSNLQNWVNRNYLQGTNVKEFHLYDRDKNEQYKEAIEKVNAREDGAKGLLTEKREMENYIHYDLIGEYFNIDCLGIKEKWDEEDIATFIIQKTRNEYNEKAVKKILSSNLSRQITKRHLEELDAYEEVKSWYEDIRDLWASC